MTARLIIREPTQQDYPSWAQLYEQYCAFYRTPFTPRIGRTVWGWIHDPDSGFECRLIQADDGRVVGLTHFREYPLPLLGAHGGYVDDLFVDPDARGDDATQLAAQAILAFGRSRGWPTISWITADNNYRARAVYDRIARRTDWVTYEVDLPTADNGE